MGWVFLLNVPLIVGALLALRAFPRPVASAGRSRPTPSAGCWRCSASAADLRPDGRAGHGWLSPRVTVAGVGARRVGALVPAERRRRAPMLRLSLFESRQFDAINPTTVLFYGALSAASYLLVLRLRAAAGYSGARRVRR